jgi:hypothetical protein
VRVRKSSPITASDVTEPRWNRQEWGKGGFVWTATGIWFMTEIQFSVERKVLMK